MPDHISCARRHLIGMAQPICLAVAIAISSALAACGGKADGTAPARASATRTVTAAMLGTEATADYKPKVAVVLCEESLAYDFSTRQQVEISSQAMVGLAGLTGVAYETLTLNQLIATPQTQFTSLWLSYCPVLSDSSHTAIKNYLTTAREAGKSIVIDGHLGFFNTQGADRGVDRTIRSLGLDYLGYMPKAEIKVSGTSHPILSNLSLAANQAISPVISGGLNLIGPMNADGKVLLTMGQFGANPGAFLTIIEKTGNLGAVVGLSSFASFSSAVSPVIGVDQQYTASNNLAMPVLIEAMLYALNNGQSGPTASLALSNGDVTMIGRLDGDQAWFGPSTKTTLDYLSKMTHEYGFSTFYGITTDFSAGPTEWNLLREYAAGIQHKGGVMGSHSASHFFNISAQNVSPEDWPREVGRSVEKVGQELSVNGQTPALRLFINPGAGAELRHYPIISQYTDFLMTQNYEFAVPYASGVMNWEIGGATSTPMAVVYASPVPDFRALYSGNGTMGAAAVIQEQRKTLDYYRDVLGRGVLYNHMWHDYAIQDAMNLKPEYLPLFELHKEYISNNKVYLPEAKDLYAKMHLAKKTNMAMSYDAARNRVTVNLDFSAVAPSHRPALSGMAVHLNNAGAIASVQIAGNPHHAYRQKQVILPSITSETTQLALTIQLGTSAQSHLSFIAKPYANLEKDGGTLKIRLTRPDITTRFCVDMSNAVDMVQVEDRIFKPNKAGEYCDIYKVTTNPVKNDFFATSIDGALSEWSGLQAYSEDPDDISGADASGNQANWRGIKVAHATDSNTLYFAYTNQSNIYISWGFQIFLDTDNNPNTGLSQHAGRQLPIGADYMIEGVLPYRYTGMGGNDWSWVRSENAQGYEVGRIWTQKTGEVFMPLEWIGSPKSFNFILFGNNAFYTQQNEIDWYPDVNSSQPYFHYDVIKP